MEIPEVDMFPVTPDCAVRLYRRKIRSMSFPTKPAAEIKTGDVVDVNESSHFAFMYSRYFQQYFLFVDSYSGEDIHDEDFDANYSVMKVFAIKGSEPVYLGVHNIIISAGVFRSPTSPWCTFSDVMIFHGNEYHNELLEFEWKKFAEEERIA
jgi:hypothetical protein